jgi:HSP20 family molecular chaperone IbpA
MPRVPKFISLLLVVVITLAAVMSSEGRSCGLNLAPRSYRYSRPTGSDPFDLVSEIFSMPTYSNSLLRQIETSRRSNSLTYDITEDPQTGVIELTMEVPGMSAKDLEIELASENQLRIRGSRKVKQHGSLALSEFDQVFTLERDVDSERVEATLSAGILTIRVPKVERVVKKIPIVVDDDGDAQLNLMNTDGHPGSSREEPKDAVVEEIDGLTVTADDNNDN